MTLSVLLARAMLETCWSWLRCFRFDMLGMGAARFEPRLDAVRRVLDDTRLQVRLARASCRHVSCPSLRRRDRRCPSPSPSLALVAPPSPSLPVSSTSPDSYFGSFTRHHALSALLRAPASPLLHPPALPPLHALPRLRPNHHLPRLGCAVPPRRAHARRRLRALHRLRSALPSSLSLLSPRGCPLADTGELQCSPAVRSAPPRSRRSRR